PRRQPRAVAMRGELMRWWIAYAAALALLALMSAGSPAASPPDGACRSGESAHVGTRPIETTPDDLHRFVSQEARPMLGTGDATLGWKTPGRPDDSELLLGQRLEEVSERTGHPALDRVRCGTAVHADILSLANVMGGITVALCDRTRDLTPKHVCEA